MPIAGRESQHESRMVARPQACLVPGCAPVGQRADSGAMRRRALAAS